MKTVELQRLIALNSNEAVKAFDSELHLLVSDEALEKYISALKVCLRVIDLKILHQW